MRKLWIGILIGIGLAIAPSVHAANYSYYRAITTTSTDSVASGTNANFPYLISGTYTWLESTSTGAAGRIQNLVTAPNGSQEPADLVFATSSANCNTAPLNFETENYVSSTGALVDWVNVPSVSTGTVIYACYGDSSVTTDQSRPSSTWNSNYKAVFHYTGTSTLSSVDSTGKTGQWTIGASGISTTTGQMVNGIHTSGADSANIQTSTSLIASGAFTASAWVNATNATTNVNAFFGNTVDQNLEIRLFGNQIAVLKADNTQYIAAGTINSNTWYDVAVTLDDSSVVAVYENGINVGTSTAISNIGGTNEIGANQNHENFVGSIDESEILTTNMTPSWILTEYNNQNSPSTFYTVGSEQTPGGPTPSPSLFTNKFLFIKGFLTI